MKLRKGIEKKTVLTINLEMKSGDLKNFNFDQPVFTKIVDLLPQYFGCYFF